MQAEGDSVEAIDVFARESRRIPSKKWRELIKKVWEADPLRCLKCSREMRIVSLIDPKGALTIRFRLLNQPQSDYRVVLECLRVLCVSIAGD